MKKNKKKILIVLGCAAVVILAAIGVGMMGSKAPAVPAQAEAEDEIRVSALNPQVGDLEVTTEFIGKVQPDESVNIFPKMAGTVLTTYFKAVSYTHLPTRTASSTSRWPRAAVPGAPLSLIHI